MSIHIDRVRIARKQTLIGESEVTGMPEQGDAESFDSLNEHIDVPEHLGSPDEQMVAGTETTDEEEPFVETRQVCCQKTTVIERLPFSLLES